MTFQLDRKYEEKVYAGVLGKIIGVYLGRPFEQWSHELILETLGPIEYYVNNKLDKPLIVTDDDITGTFTFLRALTDYGCSDEISAQQIGQTWLNNIVEGETILWWGGYGLSTEHTAYKNLKKGVFAPESGSKSLNGQAISEQIGAQIFIDGWAMVSPGDPEKAADLAKRAASVSHDGEAVYGAQIIAAMEAEAFVENDITKLIETGKKLIPRTSTIFKAIEDIQNWHSQNKDWLSTRGLISEKYGYDKFPGACHIVPNHSLIIMALLHGDGNFQESMKIINTSGWDTDCNAGNLGCLLGIKNGLDNFEGSSDWRGPVNDIMYCPTANGGETITDATRESFKIINIARSMRGLTRQLPKQGARYHFDMPGSTQGWMVRKRTNLSENTVISNVAMRPGDHSRCLSVEFEKINQTAVSEIYVNTFMPENIKNLTGKQREVFFSYNFLCSPIFYPGQEITAKIRADIRNYNEVFVKLFVRYYGENDRSVSIYSGAKKLKAGEAILNKWAPLIHDGNPVYEIGLRIEASKTTTGKIYLDSLDFSGEVQTCFKRPLHTPPFERGKEFEPPRAEMWRNSWVKATNHWTDRQIKGEAFRIGHDDGRGIIITGTSDWKDYSISSKIIFELASSGGLAARVQGLERFYAAELSNKNKFRLLKLLDGKKILAEYDIMFELFREYEIGLSVRGNLITCYLDGEEKLSVIDDSNTLKSGGIGLFVENGTLSTNQIIKN